MPFQEVTFSISTILPLSVKLSFSFCPAPADTRSHSSCSQFDGFLGSLSEDYAALPQNRASGYRWLNKKEEGNRGGAAMKSTICGCVLSRLVGLENLAHLPTGLAQS